MRAVWGQASRPKLSLCRAPRQHLNAAFRKNPAPTIFHTRPLTFSDAFGIFLAPFLAAATIVNLSWKEKQKKDWENRFADIDREIEILRARELDAWNSLQLSFALRKAARREQRSYSTAALARIQEAPVVALADAASYKYPVVPERQRNLDQVRAQSRLQDTRPHLSPPLPVHGLVQTATRDGQDEPDQETPSVDVPEWLWELERLIATKLALRLLLHPHLVDGQLLEEIGAVAATPSQPETLPGLLEQLQKVTKLESAAQRKLAYRTDRIGFRQHKSAHLLRDSILKVSHMYKRGEISPTSLIEKISQLLLDAPEPPDIKVYTQLVEVLHTCRFTTFVPLVVHAIRRSRLLLDETSLVRIITHIAHCRDIEAFDWCLREVTKSTSRVKFSQHWEWRRIAGELVPVPSSSDPRLVRTLATAALALEQISRAEAWASFLDESGYQGSSTQDLIKAFIYYYTKHSNWDKGRLWVLRVIHSDTLADIDAFRSFQDFQTLVFRMLSLCAACGKRSEYTQILGAATGAGIRPPAYDLERPGMNNEQVKKTIDEWDRIMDHHVPDRNLLNEQKIRRFQETLRSSELCQDVNVLNISTQSPVGGLKIQVMEAKKLLKEQLRESRTLQAKLQSTLDAYVTVSEDFRTSERRRMLGENRFKEQQISLDALQKELAQHRKQIDAELQTRKVEEQSAKAQQRQIQRLEVELEKLSQRSSVQPKEDQSASLQQLMNASDNAQIKRLEGQVAHLTVLIQSLHNQPEARSTSDLRFLHSQSENVAASLSTDSAFDVNPFARLVNRPRSHPDASSEFGPLDSGYCSDSSDASPPSHHFNTPRTDSISRKTTNFTNRITASEHEDHFSESAPDSSSPERPSNINKPASAANHSTDPMHTRTQKCDSSPEVTIHKYNLRPKLNDNSEKPWRIRRIVGSDLD